MHIYKYPNYVQPNLHYRSEIMKKTSIIFIIFALPLILHAASLKPVFENITILEGLSQSSVFCMRQDRQGFIWIGTEDGLNRYDGYGFSVFRPDPKDSSAIHSNNIRAIFEDPSGGLWIALRREGLNYFDFNTGKFSYFQHNPADSTSIIADDISSMIVDSDGFLWIVTRSGVDRLKGGSGIFEHIEIEKGGDNAIGIAAPSSIVQDYNGDIWLGMHPGGLYKFNRSKDAFEPFSMKLKQPVRKVREVIVDSQNTLWMNTEKGILKYDLQSNSPSLYTFKELPSVDTINSIMVDRKGYLWVATDANGLYIIDIRGGDIVHYGLKNDKKSNILDDYIWSLFEDRTGVIWVGTNSGISKFDPERDKFPLYQHDLDDNNTLPHNRVRCFYEDGEGIIWMGSWGGGLIRFNPVLEQFRQYLSQAGNPHSLPHNAVRTICGDGKNGMWVGTSMGMVHFDIKTQKFSPAEFKTSDERYLSIRSLLYDSKGNLWIGSDQHGVRLARAGSDTLEHIRQIPGNDNSLCCDSIRYIYEDMSGKIWIGTLDGLSVFTPETGGFTNYYPNSAKNGTVSSSNVECIYQTADETIWIGTGGGGLDKFLPADSSFKNYNKAEGLPNAVVYGILEDEKGELWLTTNGGLCRFNPQSETFRTYTPSDGVQSLEFNAGAFYKTRDGRIYAGGIAGFNAFYPNRIFDSQFPPQVAITSFGTPGNMVSYSPVLTSVFNSNQSKPLYLRFPSSDKVIQFEFAALHYANPAENRYAYMLSGFDKEWVYSDTRRFAAYTSLPAGKYFFRVKACNSDGVWNDVGITVPIMVVPPFYSAWWFRTILIFLLIASPTIYFYLRLKNVKDRSAVLGKLVQERTVELDQKNRQLAQILGERTIKLEETRDKLRTELDGKTQILARLDTLEKRYRFIFEMAVDGMLLLDNEVILDCNQSIVDMFKRDKLDLVGGSILDYSPAVQSDGEASKHKAERLFALANAGNPQRFEWIHIDSMGKDLYVEVILHRIDLVDKTYFFAILRDISERKRTEKELREKESKYRTLVESSLEGVYITQNHILKFCNQKFADMFSYKSPEELLGKNVRELVAEQSWNLVDEKVKERENGITDTIHYFFTCINSQGQEFEVEALGSRIEYDGAAAIHGVMRDVSQERRFEEQLRQAQKMEDIGRLAGGISHDFNNMLTTIMGYCDLAKDETNNNSVINEYLAEIGKGCEKAAELTKKLLAFSRRQTLRPLVLSLNDIITDIYKMLKRLIGENIQLYYLPPPEEWLTEVDPGQMEQILLNLAVNARDAMRGGGKLTIELRNETVSEEIRTSLENIPRGDYVVLTVSDSGEGIPERVRIHIFEPFFTTKPKGEGTGLGLATVYGIVKQSGGFIDVKSEEGEGTTFIIYIPRVIDKPKHEFFTEETFLPITGNESILLVEDDASLREMTVKILSRQGYNVTEAQNGEDAVAICQAMTAPVDLIVTDVVMPGISGVEAMARIREFWPDVKVLYMSGYSDKSLFKREILIEPIEYLSKPFDSVTISKKIRQVLDK